MTKEEIESDEVVHFENLSFQINTVEQVKSNIAINDFIALKLLGINNKYELDQEIDVRLEDGSLIGSLCTKPENSKLDFDKLTEKKYIAYLTEVGKDIFLSNVLEIHYSYIVINKNDIEKYYNKFYQTAPVWGSFFHKSKLRNHSSSTRAVGSITAVESLKFPTSIHHSSSIKAILEPFVFERFLKKYHQIELLMDLDIVNKIRNLKNDLLGISNLFSELSSNELNRLKIILNDRITDFVSLSAHLYEIVRFPNEGENIFQKYTKAGNPIRELSEFRSLVSLPSFSEANMATIRRTLTGRTYEYFLIDLAIYWIYRIRNSIAHQRIGEYILTDKEEEFMLDFAEPLIDHVLIQIYMSRV
ncbi:hypothetical protein OQX63_20585 [Pedobacter sp. PF22-3]|uniref:hypothetical protein n=1 Tax=Pedobacter sp. PF22-3 TaxID=2994467 RepID=UPI002245E635|nr:hypothetical protein [Pedobacter sp. PF22-3]MCX2495904.1 hypothetical protein [Pedobacter sp. PF22-3]